MTTAHPLTHLLRLEAESIHILREVAAEVEVEVERPGMLYSTGKDSKARSGTLRNFTGIDSP